MISNPNRKGDEFKNELNNRKVFLNEDIRENSLSLSEIVHEKNEDDRIVELMLIEDEYNFLYKDDDFFFIWNQASNA